MFFYKDLAYILSIWPPHNAIEFSTHTSLVADYSSKCGQCNWAPESGSVLMINSHVPSDINEASMVLGKLLDASHDFPVSISKLEGMVERQCM